MCSPKKWIFALCTIAVLAGAYFGARFFLLGPATSEKLQEAFNNALNTHDTAALARPIDPNQKPLQDQKAIAAFSESLNKESIANYGAGIQTAVDRVTESLKNDSSGKNPSLSFTDVSWVGLVGKSSWLGTQWYVHLPPCQIKRMERRKPKISGSAIP